MRFSQDLAKGTVVPIVLSLLAEGPRYGYELVKVVNARTRGRLEWKEGTLYPTLHQLEASGLVKADWLEAPASDKAAGDAGDAPAVASGRRRRYYRLTPKGEAELSRRTREWREFSEAVNTFFAGD